MMFMCLIGVFEVNKVLFMVCFFVSVIFLVGVVSNVDVLLEMRYRINVLWFSFCSRVSNFCVVFSFILLGIGCVVLIMWMFCRGCEYL